MGSIEKYQEYACLPEIATILTFKVYVCIENNLEFILCIPVLPNLFH